MWRKLPALHYNHNMFPEDRVLVAFLPSPADLDLLENEGWYRIPYRQAPKGLHAEWLAFYFGRRFGDRKWAVQAYTRNLGHELVRRRDLIPSEPDHPRADAPYYKVQLGPLEWLEQPIISLRWRRITFIHTTGDRFLTATEINDLYADGDDYVDRLYATLKEHGVQPERNYRVEEEGTAYDVPLAVLCADGRITVTADEVPTTAVGVTTLAERIIRETASRGGERRRAE